MTHTPGIKPVLTTLGAAVVGLVIAGLPMAAAGDHTNERDGVDIRQVRHGNVEVPADDRPNAPANWRRLLNQIDTPPTTTRKAAPGECVYDPRHLPHTADAIEGWYRDCRARH